MKELQLPAKLLIVEDNKDTSEKESSTFRSLGFEVEVVDRGDLAVPKMKSFMPHIILLDLELPGSFGHEIVEQMNADEELSGIPVVVFSVHMSDFSDPSALDTKFFWAQYKKTGNREPRVVKNTPGQNSLMQLIMLVCDACGETYGKIPGKMGEFLAKKMPNNAPPFEAV